MADLTQPGSFSIPTEKPKIPSGLNVLTILTFVGCGLGFLSTIWNFTNAKSGLDKMEAAINSPDYENMPALAKKFMSPEALEIARKSYENRIPLTLIGLIGIVLCVYGALQMRKLKMQGYYLWLAGEILPFISSVIFLGIASMSGVMGIIFIGITLLFVLLYSAQRKYLVN